MTIFNDLKHLIENNSNEIEAWFDEQYGDAKPLFYSSVDLRHSGHKLVPVDNNLFPAGFNLLDAPSTERAAFQAKRYIEAHHPEATCIAIVPENHTRNTFYLQNVYALQQIIKQAGYNAMVTGLFNDETLELETASGNTLTINPLQRDGNIVKSGDNTPSLILINNDGSSGSPDALKDIEQPVFPPIGLGWHKRRKTHHFESYRQVAMAFGNTFNIDSWLIGAFFTKCGSVNFKEKQGLECVALNVERTLTKIQNKYDEYGITEKPYVFIKADSGTYGMGIMTAHSGEDVLEINKKSRKKMDTIKEGITNTEVIIQEGVPTVDKVEGNPAEPMVYLVGGQPVSCFYRVNKERDAEGNLNSSGMSFANNSSQDVPREILCPTQGLIAKLSTLAATKECYEPSWVI